MAIKGESVWIDVEGPLRETERAMLFDTDDGEKWIPRSQVGARRREGNRIVRLEVSRWWAGREGLADPKDER